MAILMAESSVASLVPRSLVGDIAVFRFAIDFAAPSFRRLKGLGYPPNPLLETVCRHVGTQTIFWPESFSQHISHLFM